MVHSLPLEYWLSWRRNGVDPLRWYPVPRETPSAGAQNTQRWGKFAMFELPILLFPSIQYGGTAAPGWESDEGKVLYNYIAKDVTEPDWHDLYLIHHTNGRIAIQQIHPTPECRNLSVQTSNTTTRLYAQERLCLNLVYFRTKYCWSLFQTLPVYQYVVSSVLQE